MSRRAPLAAFRIARARPRVRRQLQPDAIRLFYFAQLRSILGRAHALVTSEVLPLVQAMLPEEHRTDASDRERINALMAEVARRFQADMSTRRFTALAKQVAARTSDFNRAQLIGQIASSIGITPTILDAGLAERLVAFTAENVGLIRSIPAQYFEQVQERVETAVETGTRASTLAADLEQRFNVAESKARLVANDQVGKLTGGLNDVRQQEIGIERAEWATVDDNRVRDSHDELKGQVYTLGEGLIDSQTGERVLPGQAINCRCYGVPDLTDLLG